MQNRNRLLDAAEAVFLEAGMQAPLDAVAARAGIGRATLFRNFADRHALVAGLLDRTLAAIEEEAGRGDGDPQALGCLLRFVADRMIAHSPLTEYWQACGRGTPEFHAGLRRFMAAFERPIACAAARGACRADLAPADIMLMMSMLGGALHEREPAVRRELAARAWRFIAEMAQLRDPA